MATNPAAMDPAAALEAFEKTRYYGNEGLMMGPVFMGGTFDLMLFGVMITLFGYWRMYSREEKKFTKCIVYPAVILSICFTLLVICYEMWLFVYNFGTYSQFDDVKWLQGVVAGDVLVSVLCQTYYGVRAYKLLGNSKIFASWLVLCLLTELGGAISAVVVINAVIHTLQDAVKVQPVLYAWLAGQVGADVAITACTTYKLWKARTGWTKTDQLVKKLVAFTVETQLPPTVVAIVYMGVFAGNTSAPNMTLAFILSLSKLYMVGLLAMLCSRFHMRGAAPTDAFTENTYALGTSKHNQPTIHISTETYTQVSKAGTTGLFPLGVNRQQQSQNTTTGEQLDIDLANYSSNDSQTDIESQKQGKGDDDSSQKQLNEKY